MTDTWSKLRNRITTACTLREHLLEGQFSPGLRSASIMALPEEDEAQAAVELPKTDQEQLLEWLLQALILQLHWTPTYLEMQLLPLILRQPHRSLVVKAQFGSGLLYCSVIAMVARATQIFLSSQVICVTVTRELAMLMHSLAQKVAAHTDISVACTEVKPTRAKAGEPGSSTYQINDQIVTATLPGLRQWVGTGRLNLSNTAVLVFNDADVMLQAGDRCCQTVSMIQEVTAARLGKPLQVLMWGLQLDDHARGTIAPALPGCQMINQHADEVRLPLTLQQHQLELPNQAEKKRALRAFRNTTVITVRLQYSSVPMRVCYNCLGCCLRSGLSNAIRDSQVNKFAQGLTQVLITTDIMACNTHILQQVTLTINYNPPALLGRHGDHDQSLFHTYVRRVCSSKPNQLVFNLWAGQAEGKSIAALEKHFDLKICTLDLVQIEHILSFNM